MKSDFDCFIWRSLNYSPPPTLSELLFGLIKVLSSEENTGLPSVVDDFNVDGLIKKLLKIFGERRILLVLDGWEKIIEERQLTFIPEQPKKLINDNYNGNFLELIHICQHITLVFAGILT